MTSGADDLLAEIESAARDGMVPPRRMWTMVTGPDADYVGSGRETLKLFVNKGLVYPHSSVLDIGCGLGRVAIHFAEYLKTPGSYEGFDVEPLRIYWCHKAIAARHPHIRFQCMPILNAYNPGGGIPAAEFRFPYSAESFDFVYLGSVFTHMLGEDVRNYIGEIARVLRPGGRCFASFYLLNESTKQGIAAGTAAFTFSIPYGGCWVEYADWPESAVAHEESRVLEMVAAAELTLDEPINRGGWETHGQHAQDIVVFGKPSPTARAEFKEVLSRQKAEAEEAITLLRTEFAIRSERQVNEIEALSRTVEDVRAEFAEFRQAVEMALRMGGEEIQALKRLDNRTLLERLRRKRRRI